ncbi:MAG: GNAT family N-acetyltransferase [Kurthia sp.]|nr:GNAT family N-acetyltransferase [Candidatus Kurthia equi]
MHKNWNLLLVENTYLESERILLRPVTLEDAQAIFEYTSDEETTRYLYDAHIDLEQTKRMIANYYMKEPIGKYAMVLKETNKVIGTIEFRVDDWSEAGDLGFTMNRLYWGHGYMTEAANLIIQLAFEKLELARVFAGHEIANEASGKVLLRIGMQLDGVLRKHEKIKGKLVDSMYYSILKEDYFSTKNNI